MTRITADMIRECRNKMDGIIAADADDRPIVRSAIHYDGPDPLYDGSGDQIVVFSTFDLTFGDFSDVTDGDRAKYLTQFWADLVTEAREAEAAGADGEGR